MLFMVTITIQTGFNVAKCGVWVRRKPQQMSESFDRDDRLDHHNAPSDDHDDLAGWLFSWKYLSWLDN